MTTTSNTSMFFVTANIASCFEKPKNMLTSWLDELLKVIADHNPQFIAIHCQEVGGKHYESSMDSVHIFISDLLKRVTQLDYTKARIFIDENYFSPDKFTALGNLYFIRSDVQDVQIWDFHEKRYLECEGIDKYFGCIEDITTKQKSKFPQEFFPECKWSRKGFLRTRWCINGTQIDLVNIHLFHDASNFVAMDSSPSIYTVNRKRAMDHTLDKFHNDEYDNIPLFLFGDFNFRVDTKGVVEQKLGNDCIMEETIINGEKARLFKDSNDKLLLSISKKSFIHYQHNSIFMKENGKWLLPFDKEMQQFGSRLFEYPVSFPPSYPFEEGINSTDGRLYMKTRCPSWCDRIIMSHNAKCLLEKGNADVKYNVIGMGSRMGDHKPVGLRVEMPMGAGIVECCCPRVPCTNFVHVPEADCFVVGAWCRCQTYPKFSDTVDFIRCSVPPPDSLISACSPIATYNVDPNSIKLDVSQLMDQIDYRTSKEQPELRYVESSNISNIDNLTERYVVMPDLSLKESNIQSKTRASNSNANIEDLNLKRVNSDPIKTRIQLEKLKNKPNVKSNVELSHSLDSKPNSKLHARLRLRVGSSRLVSHHSSSSEEWFEEVPPTPEDEKVPECSFFLSNSSTPSLLSGQKPEKSSQVDQLDLQSQISYYSEDDSISMIASILKTPRFLTQDNSLNNLLINDGSQSQFDNESRSAQSDQTDEYSHRVDSGSNVIPYPAVDSDNSVKPTVANSAIVQDESVLLSKSVPDKMEGINVGEVSTSDCCCALS